MTNSPSYSSPDPTLLSELPVRVTIPVAWGDLDALQHVNNTVYFRWFEYGARVAVQASRLARREARGRRWADLG